MLIIRFKLIESEIGGLQVGCNVVCKLTPGSYSFEYMPSKEYRHIYSLDSKLFELMENKEVKEILEEVIPSLASNPALGFLFQNTLKQISAGGMDLGIDWDYALNRIDRELKHRAISIL